VLITHERNVAESAQRIVRILDGEVDSAMSAAAGNVR